MPAATAALEVLVQAGIAHTVRPYEHDPAVINYGAEAAAALGIDPERLFKTLVVDLGSERPELAVAVVPVATQLDLKHFAQVMGAKKAAMADKALVTRSTGYLLGGVSPVGQKIPLPTVIDETAQLWDTILVSAGRRGLQVELAATDLARACQASFADIAR
jgi:Cys-tRNA(Pro)/Cys-tRNA(Cys) deacylase